MIYTRNSITDLLPDNSIGCEIGVFEGEFSSVLLASNKFKQLYLVDTFSGPASNFDIFYSDASVLENHVKNKFATYNNVLVCKQDSIDFLTTVPEKLFDFIYIDTVHSYEHTAKELELSYRCTKQNGLICGHDYTEKFFPGVVRAVKEFCQTYNLAFQVTEHIENYPSFIIRKN